MRFFLIGICVDLAIATILIGLTLIYYLATYKGKCPELFITTNTNCSLPEYVGFYFVIVFMVLYVAPWFVVVPAIIPPMVGLIIGCVFRDR